MRCLATLVVLFLLFAPELSSSKVLDSARIQCDDTEASREALEECLSKLEIEKQRGKAKPNQIKAPVLEGEALSELLLNEKISSISSVKLPDDI